jgi:heterodisulfide reductase subunit A-like polyferredoxin
MNTGGELQRRLARRVVEVGMGADASHQVVVIGGGFAGLNAVRGLREAPVVALRESSQCGASAVPTSR